MGREEAEQAVARKKATRKALRQAEREAKAEAGAAPPTADEAAPAPTVSINMQPTLGSQASVTFASLGLDARILKAMRKMGFETPTAVQARCIPLALEGKDLLARAPTGSGKTVAYAAPLLQQILTELDLSSEPHADVRALILVPTRELCNQVHATVSSLLAYAAGAVSVAHVAGDEPLEAQRARLAPGSLPHVIIATPARLLQHLRAGSLRLREGALSWLVVDEADLLQSYGYAPDLEAIGPLLPPCVQTLLMSATLTPDLNSVSSLLLHNPTTVDVGGVGGTDSSSAGALAGSVPGALSQYLVTCQSKDKFLLIFALLKLNRIPGRSLVFCNDVARSFKLKLFLEQFGVHCGVLNAELPLNSRWHAIQAFNKGAFDLLIATDDPVLRAAHEEACGRKKGAKRQRASADGSGGDGKGGQWQAEFGVSRGIDFQGVTAVINFDLPATLAVYQHRIGRTARAGLEGTAISLVSADEAAESSYADELRVLYGEALRPLHVEMGKLASFRYRVDDAIRAVTRAAVQEARLRELRAEILNSERLKEHFESNPHDLKVLRHDKPLATVRAAPELKRIPKYLLPDRRDAVDGALGAKMAGIAKAARKQQSRHKLVGKGRKKADPLKSFSASKGKGKHAAARSAAGKSRDKRNR